jgi:hypothetical protein
MSTVHSAINLPIGGTTVALGPVTVNTAYPAKLAKNNKPYRNIEVADGSGSVKITLWGAASDLPIEKGNTVTIKGPLKRGEYNGAPQLSGENGLALAGGGAPASAPGAPQSAEDKLTHVQLADQMAEFVVELEQALINKGVQKEVVNKILERAPEAAALWWFGAKGLNMASLPEAVEDYCPE